MVLIGALLSLWKRKSRNKGFSVTYLRHTQECSECGTAFKEAGSRGSPRVRAAIKLASPVGHVSHYGGAGTSGASAEQTPS